MVDWMDVLHSVFDNPPNLDTFQTIVQFCRSLSLNSLFPVSVLGSFSKKLIVYHDPLQYRVVTVCVFVCVCVCVCVCVWVCKILLI